METTKTFLYFLNGIPQKMLSESEARVVLGITGPEPAKPVVPVPLFGEPKTYEGLTGQGDKVYSLTGYPYLLVESKDSPGTFWLRPTNLVYTLTPGRVRLNTANNPANPNVLPNAPVSIPGYETRYFDGDRKKEPYYVRTDATSTQAAGAQIKTTHVELNPLTAS